MEDNGLTQEIDTQLVQYGRSGYNMSELKVTLSVMLLRLYPNEAAFDESKHHIRQKIMEGFPDERQALMRKLWKDARNDGTLRLRNNAWEVLNYLLRQLKVFCYNKPCKKSKLSRIVKEVDQEKCGKRLYCFFFHYYHRKKKCNLK